MSATVTLRRPQDSPTASSQDPAFPDNSYASTLPDPFGDPGSEFSHSLSTASSSTIPSPSTQRSLPPILPHHPAHPPSKAIHVARVARAKRSELLRRLQEYRTALVESRQRITELRKDWEQRRLTLDRRRTNLREAKGLLVVDEPRRTSLGEGSTAEGRRWRLGVRRRASEHTESAEAATQNEGLGTRVWATRASLDSLKRENELLLSELSRTRGILAKEVFSLFSVASTAQQSPPRSSNRFSQAWGGLGSSPLSLLPDGMPAAFAPLRRPGVEGRLPAGGFRSSNTPGRQGPGGLVPVGTPNPVTTLSAWTIVNLPLASPVDVRKYPREDINGALSYTALLLQLLSAYLGIHLPFVIESQGGRNIIMPNELWSGTGANKHIVQLSETAYDALKSFNAASGDRANDSGSTSTFGLGASALSVLESFVQLPSTERLTAMLGASGAESGAKGSTASAATGTSGASASSRSSHGTGSDAIASRSAAVDEYVSVVSMLSYNAAYLASVQGVRVDLVSAATSPLALLSRAMASQTLGKRAHTTYASDAHIRNLGKNDIEWSQVRLILDPYRGSGGAAGDAAGRGGSGASGSSTRAGSSARRSEASGGKAPASSGSGTGARGTRGNGGSANAEPRPASRTSGEGQAADRRVRDQQGRAARESVRPRDGRFRQSGADDRGTAGDDDWDVV